jgi:hypothetical protein
VYKKLAAEFEGDAKVTIAAMDATANDVPEGLQAIAAAACAPLTTPWR